MENQADILPICGVILVRVSLTIVCALSKILYKISKVFPTSTKSDGPVENIQIVGGTKPEEVFVYFFVFFFQVTQSTMEGDLRY